MRLPQPRSGRGWLVSAAVALVAAVACFLLSSLPDEPRYQGRPLSEWLSLAGTGTTNAPDALEDIGPEAIPSLIRAVRRPDPLIPRLLERWQKNLPAALTPLMDSQVRAVRMRIVAAEHLRRFGPDARDAVPALLDAIRRGARDKQNLSRRTQEFMALASALAAIGADAVPGLSRALTDRDPSVRYRAALLLGRLGNPRLWPKESWSEGFNDNLAFGPHGHAAAPAVPALVEALSTPEPYVRDAVCATLISIGREARVAEPALRRMIEKGTTRDRLLALRTLFRLGRPPPDFLYLLGRALEDADMTERRTALWDLARAGAEAEPAFPQVLQRLRTASERGLPGSEMLGLSFLGPVAASILPELLTQRGLASTAGSTYFALKFPEAVASWGPAVLDDAIPLLADPDAGVAISAAGILQHLGREAETAVPELEACLRHPNLSVRFTAWQALDAIGRDGGDTLPVLFRALKDADSEGRRRAVRSLGLLGPRADEAVGYLIDYALDDRNNAEVVFSVATTLRQIRSHAPVVVLFLGSSLAFDERPRPYTFIAPGSAVDAVLAALTDIGPAAKQADPKVVARIRAKVRSHPVAAARALWAIEGDATEVLAVLVESIERGEAVAAIEALGVMGPAARPAVPKLREVLQRRSGTMEWFWYTAHALWRIEGDDALHIEAHRRNLSLWAILERDEAHKEFLPHHAAEMAFLVPHLMDHLNDFDARSEKIRSDSAEVLEAIGAPAAPALRDAMVDEDPWTAPIIARVLWRIEHRPPEVLPWLIRGLRHFDPAERRETIVTLAEIGEPAIPSLVTALDDRLIATRFGATVALRRIGPPAAAAAPKLEALLASTNKVLRYEAGRALQAIRAK